MEYSVKGADIKLLDKEFGSFFYEKLSLQTSRHNFLINAETSDGITAQNLQLICVNVAMSLNRLITGDDVIACLCENEWLSIVPIVSSFYLGTTIALINPSYTLRELIHNFSLSQPKVVFCKRSALRHVLDAKAELSCIQTVILMEENGEEGFITIYDLMKQSNYIGNFKPTSVDQSKTAVILLSSGTSGQQKGVKISYSNLAALLPCYSCIDCIGLTPDVVCLLLIPLFHAFGLYFALYGVVFGSKAVFLKAFRPELFLQSIQDYKVNKLPIVPALAIFMCKNPLVDNYNLWSLRDVICGAAPLSQNVLNLLQNRLKVIVRQAYGLTEAGLVSIVTPNTPSKPNSAGAIGYNFTVILKDEYTKEIVPKNCRGEICIKGPTIFSGYVQNSDETKIAFDENGYLLTGDIGYFDDDNCLYVVDRMKELIKCKGFQVAPAELEGILLDHPGVKEVAVIGIPDERAGELACAVVVKQPDAQVTENELVDFLKGKVSKYKELNGGVQFADDIPKNANGKIMKRDIRKYINAAVRHHS